MAEPAGHYDPLVVTERSALFRSAADSAGTELEAREAAAVTVAANLHAYETAIDLLGDRAPSDEYDHLAELQERYNREHAVLQAFVDTLSEDFEEVFSAAVARAVAAVEVEVEGEVQGESEVQGEVVECPAFVAVGSSLPGLPKRTEPNADCTGEDLNDPLAAAVDADPELKAALAEIDSLAWPEITVPSEPRAPFGDGERTVFVPDLLRAVAPSAMTRIDRADAEQRLAFEAAIEQGASTKDLEALVDEAHAVTTATAAARAELAAPVLDAAEAALQKLARSGQPKTTWCAYPAAFGGCGLPDAGSEVVGRVAADKKVRKAAPAD